MRFRDFARRWCTALVVVTCAAGLCPELADARSEESPESTLRRMEGAIARLRAEVARYPERAGLWQGWISQESMLIAARANLAVERGAPEDRAAVEAEIEERTRQICDEWMRARPAEAAPAILAAGLGRTPDERDEAIVALTARYPDDAGLVHRVAQILRYRGEEKRAEELLEEFAATHPAAVAPAAAAAGVTAQAGRAREESAPSREARVAAADAGETVMAVAAGLDERAQPELAIAVLEQYLDREGADSRVVEALGDRLLSSGQIERADRLADRLGESTPALLLRARARVVDDDPAAAASAYRSFFAAGGFGEAPTFEYLAAVASAAPPSRRRAELESAIDFLCRQRGVRGRDPEPVCAARLLELADEPESAVRTLESAAAAAPDNVKIAEAAALAAAAGPDRRAAEAAARRWIDVAPRSLEAWALLAQVVGANGDPAQVERVVNDSERALGEPAVGAVVELGRLLIDRGETRRALEWLSAARERTNWNYPPLDAQLERGYRQLARQHG